MRASEREIALSEGRLTLLLLAGLLGLAVVFFAGVRVGAGVPSVLPVVRARPSVSPVASRPARLGSAATPTARRTDLPPGFIGPPRH